jgi:hypothetical protein
LYSNGVIEFKGFSDYYFDLITMSSIFAGFLFSSLTLILGLGKSSTTIFLERADQMGSIFFNLVGGIMFSVLSIMALFIQFMLRCVNDIWFLIDIYLIIVVIGFFLFAVFDVRLVIRCIRQEIRKNIPDKTKMVTYNKSKGE